jgi:hypothetical protein
VLGIKEQAAWDVSPSEGVLSGAGLLGVPKTDLEGKLFRIFRYEFSENSGVFWRSSEIAPTEDSKSRYADSLSVE